MFRKLCAVAVVALIVSPFTAPFRTVRSTRPTVVLIDQDDSDAIVAPPAIAAGCLKIAPVFGIAAVSTAIGDRAAAFIQHTPAAPAPAPDRSAFSTILRV